MSDQTNNDNGNHIDGRTREGKAQREAQRAAFTARDDQREPTRGLARESDREPEREHRGGEQIVGRNGEVLSRKRKGGVDPYDIPKEIIPPGWDYQWNVISVVGNSDVVMDQGMGMHENGWRPVPAERHPGRFVPRGRTGEIIRGGMRLEERPLALTEQARAEDIKNARQLMRDRDQSLMGGKANLRGNMPEGFAMGGRYRGTGGDLRMSIDRALDVQPPSHQLADPGE